MDKKILRLIGKKYRAHGRGPDFYDCWGLAITAAEILTEKKIPDYKLNPEEKEKNTILMRLAISDHEWERVPQEKIRPGVIIAFQLHAPGYITHAGVAIGGRNFIQCTDKHGVTIESIKKYQKFIEGFYAYKG